MIYDLRSIKQADVKDKIVFLRADLDIPLNNGLIVDDTRLNSWFPTLEYLLKQNAKIIIAGHLGRPKKQFTIHNSQFTISEPELSLKPVAEWIAGKLRIQNSELRIQDINGFSGWKLSENFFLLENLRFYKQEEENDPDFSQKLALLAQVYVNDAFASTHRAHASIVGITKYLPSYAGLRLEKEVEVLSEILEKPKRPLCVIIGGAKIETKLPLVSKMHGFADYVLVGGEIAENDKILLKVAHEKTIGRRSALLVADLTQNSKDITQKSAENFVQIVKNANTIIWNGPMGLVEEKENQNGTNILANGIVEAVADTVVGGGDTIAFLKERKLLEEFTFVSTGGGAMLEFLAGIKLPGLVVLEK